MRLLARYWGYLVLVAVVAFWVTGAGGAIAVILFSVAAAVYFLFQAPVWCGAVTRTGTLCRRNSSGLLMGCSYRQHKWQRVRMTVVPHAWRELNHGLWISPSVSVTTLAALSSVVSALAAVVALLVSG